MAFYDGCDMAYGSEQMRFYDGNRAKVPGGSTTVRGVPPSPKEHWKSSPDDHDYPAAHDYLSLSLSEDQTAKVVEALKNAPLAHRKAKDLLRASALEALPSNNVHVAKDIERVHNGQQLSPVLLVRGDAPRGAPLVIADGYHRICASYFLDEDADIPCRLVDCPAPKS
jgi:hypothetical protein